MLATTCPTRDARLFKNNDEIKKSPAQENAGDI
jgi:hypothetical protein